MFGTWKVMLDSFRIAKTQQMPFSVSCISKRTPYGAGVIKPAKALALFTQIWQLTHEWIAYIFHFNMIYDLCLLVELRVSSEVKRSPKHKIYEFSPKIQKISVCHWSLSTDINIFFYLNWLLTIYWQFWEKFFFRLN